MAAEKYRHRIQIEEPVRSPDGQGGPIVSWKLIKGGSTFAQVRPVTSFDRYDAGRIFNDTTHTVRTRYMRGVSSGQRIIFRGRVLIVQGVFNEDEADKELSISCQELPVSETGGTSPVDVSESEVIA